MTFKKKMLALAAAGALSAVTALPAMAFENEFHGMYKLKYFLSNYESGGSGFIAPTRENIKSANYFEQRARLQYIAKASDDLRLVTHFEIDSVFGDKAQGGISTASVADGSFAFRNSGAAMESDAVNLETKHVFLDFKIPSTPTRVQAGIQPVKDVFKGVFLDVDLAGLNTTSKMGPATLGLGYFRAYDQSFFSTGTGTSAAAGTARPRGMDDLHIFALTGNFALSKDASLGAAYYLYADDRNTNQINVHVLGVNFDAKLGALGLSGFAAMQQGNARMHGATPTTVTATSTPATKAALSGYAFNVAAKMAAGPGTFKTAALWTTGDDGRDTINTAWKSVSTTLNEKTGTAGNSYNESGMFLLNRNAAAGGTSTDHALVQTTNNGDQGVILYTLGYDAKFTPKSYTNFNLGFAWASKQNRNVLDVKTKQNAGTNFIGTELNAEAGYKMYDNLTASFQVAYVMLGGYYKNTATKGDGTAADPENPYTARLVLSYAF